MMNPASDVRFSPSPTPSMTSIVPPMQNSSDEPMTVPARAPIKSMMTAMTMATDSNRLAMKRLLASRAMRFSG